MRLTVSRRIGDERTGAISVVDAIELDYRVGRILMQYI